MANLLFPLPWNRRGLPHQSGHGFAVASVVDFGSLERRHKSRRDDPLCRAGLLCQGNGEICVAFQRAAVPGHNCRLNVHHLAHWNKAKPVMVS